VLSSTIWAVTNKRTETVTVADIRKDDGEAIAKARTSTLLTMRGILLGKRRFSLVTWTQ
jgi:hypothetical protein